MLILIVLIINIVVRILKIGVWIVVLSVVVKFCLVVILRWVVIDCNKIVVIIENNSV